VVAGRPSSSPAAASTNAPVQIDTSRAPGRTWASVSANSPGSSPRSQTGPMSREAGTITVSASASASGPAEASTEKSQLVRTGRPGAGETVNTE